MKPKAYFFPGMGADHRLYAAMEIKGVEAVFIDWPVPQGAKGLAEYAAEIANAFIDSSEEHFLVGSSMGGMVAVEISHLTHPLHTFLLSAPATCSEFPWMLKAIRTLGIHRLFGPKSTWALSSYSDLFMGFQNHEHKKMFYEMMRGYTPEFLHFAIKSVVEWRGSSPPNAYTQVLGSKDRLFKVASCSRVPVVLHGGGHFATFEFPAELTVILNSQFSATPTKPKPSI